MFIFLCEVPKWIIMSEYESLLSSRERDEEERVRNLPSKNYRKFLMIYLPIHYVIHTITLLLQWNYMQKIKDLYNEEDFRKVSLSDWFYIIFFGQHDNFSPKSECFVYMYTKKNLSGESSEVLKMWNFFYFFKVFYMDLTWIYIFHWCFLFLSSHF